MKPTHFDALQHFECCFNCIGEDKRLLGVFVILTPELYSC